MPTPYRLTILTYCLPGNVYRTLEGKRVTKDTPGAVAARTKAKHWYGRFTDADGVRRRVKLSTDKATAVTILSRLVLDASLRKHGVTDPTAEHADTPIAKHLEHWAAHLRTMTNSRGRKNTETHVRVTLQRARRVIEACEFSRLRDIAAGRVEACIAGLTVSRGGERPRSLSAQSRNFHLQAIRQFVHWLLDEERLQRNPLAKLKKENVELDQRRKRRAFSNDELAWLLAEAAASKRLFRGLTGADRDSLYRTALGTGFRAGELASLTPGSFDLDQAAVNVRGEVTKDRKAIKGRPIPLALVNHLRGYLAGKPIDKPIWKGSWCKKGARMMREDLAAARAAWVRDGSDEAQWRKRRADEIFLAYHNADGEWADFHALRHTFISQLAAAGVSQKLTQDLARHKDPSTTARYTHAERQGFVDAVNRLPSPAAAEKPGN